MADHDSYHDYRPDPLFVAKSHLATAPRADESAHIPKAALDACAGVLDGFHDWFVWGDDGKQVREPDAFARIEAARIAALNRTAEAQGMGPNNFHAEEWKDLTFEQKKTFIRGLSWDDCCRAILQDEGGDTLKETFNGCDLDGKPTPAGTTALNGNYKANSIPYFPYAARLLELAGAWAAVKARFLEEPLEWEKATPQPPKVLPTSDPRAATRMTLTKVQGKKIMVIMLNYRMTWAWDAFCCLKKGGVKGDRKKCRILAKAVGSADLTSDIDITVSGEDDVGAVIELNRAHRKAYGGKESLHLTDTMFYIRDWMTVSDSINSDSAEKKPPADQPDKLKPRKPAAEVCAPKGTASYDDFDTSLQVQVLDVIGDYGGLMKIRRYCSDEQWKVFEKAMLKGISMGGLTGEQMPLFARVKKVDALYRTWFYDPIRARCDGLVEGQSDESRHFNEHFRTRLTEPLFKLEAMQKADRNRFIKECNLAYCELMAKARADEKKLRADEAMKGDFTWFQNYGSPLVGVNSGFNLAGTQTWTERQSLWVGEATMFASEAYNCQGTLWSVVGGQGGAKPANLGIEHFLQTFNEQIGDALKELWEYWYEAEEAHSGGEKKLLAGAGFYRASKYEGRMGEVVMAMKNMLTEQGKREIKSIDDRAMAKWEAENEGKAEKDKKPKPKPYVSPYLPMMKHRKEVWAKLFPGELTPDEVDCGVLNFESELGRVFDKHLADLVNIRKLRKMPKGGPDYGDKSKSENQKLAWDTVAKVLQNDPFKTMRTDPERMLLEWDTASEFRVAPALSVDADDKRPKAAQVNLANLMSHLLTHAVIVNRQVRKVLSRGPADVYVRSFAA